MIGFVGLFILIGFILVFSIFKFMYCKFGFYKNFDDGYIYVLCKVVEKIIYDIIVKYD